MLTIPHCEYGMMNSVVPTPRNTCGLTSTMRSCSTRPHPRFKIQNGVRRYERDVAMLEAQQDTCIHCDLPTVNCPYHNSIFELLNADTMRTQHDDARGAAGNLVDIVFFHLLMPTT